jgi:hypothetical protein
MKNLLSIFFALTALLLAPDARAQQKGIRAEVPFDFVVGNRAYPAGEYVLKSTLNDTGILRMENVQEVSAVFISSNPCAEGTPSKETKLVFHRMAGRYFLYQVWTAGNVTGREFPKSRVEVELAQNYEKPDVVIVAAILTR